MCFYVGYMKSDIKIMVNPLFILEDWGYLEGICLFIFYLFCYRFNGRKEKSDFIFSMSCHNCPIIIIQKNLFFTYCCWANLILSI